MLNVVPIYILLDNEGVIIGHVDCTASDNMNRALCDGQGVNGFPTLNIYKDGEKVTVMFDKENFVLQFLYRLKSIMAREI